MLCLFAFIVLLMKAVENPDCKGLLQSWELFLDFGRWKQVCTLFLEREVLLILHLMGILLVP